jgi:dihydropyrimidinase
MTQLIIRNGTIVTATRNFKGSILVRNGRIEEVYNDGDIVPSSEREIDASGKYIFPGGVDPHVHMHLKTSAGYSSDDFISGSKAALFGGTTTLIDFVTPERGQSIIEAVKNRKIEAENCLTDYTFHVSPVEWTENTSEELNWCIIKEGIPSFKVYMAYKSSIGLEDEEIRKVMEVIAKSGGTLAIHCEMGDAIDVLHSIFASEGRLDTKYHAFSRPAYLESEAVKTAVDLAYETGCPLYIVHVSAADSMEYIRQAQSRGQKVFAETCPQYLLLDKSEYEGDFHQVAPYIMSPPLRKQEDNQALWKAITDNTIQSIGTDHCPFTMKQKEQGKDDFRKIPNGAGGVEHRLELLYTFGVMEKRISMNRFVELTSTNPARIFGIYPQKGEIAKGSDADLLIWNPDKEKTISVKTHHQNSDINIYEGIEIKGSTEYVIKDGKVIIEKGKIINENIKGKFLKVDSGINR